MKLSYSQNDDLTITIRDADGGPDVRVSLAEVMMMAANRPTFGIETIETLYRAHVPPAVEAAEPDTSLAPSSDEDHQNVKVRVVSDQHANNTSVYVGNKPIGNVKAVDWHCEAGFAGMLHVEMILPAMELVASPENTQFHLLLPGGDLCLTVAQFMKIRDALEAHKTDGAVALDEKWAGHDC